MQRIAIKMLVGDRAKYLSLVFGLAFAVLLIAQQGSIFLGLMLRATGFLQNIAQPDLWIADPHTRYIGEIRALNDHDLTRVRSIAGIAWAVPFFASRCEVDLPNGAYKTVELIGIDRSSLVGQPPEMVQGRLEDLRPPRCRAGGGIFPVQVGQHPDRPGRSSSTTAARHRRGVLPGQAGF